MAVPEEFGNPSSPHTVGERAAAGLADARAALAGWFGCRACDIVFTSGGTEADNLAMKGIALGYPRGRHLVTAHRIDTRPSSSPSDYLRRLHGFEVTFVDLEPDGMVTPHRANRIRDQRPDTAGVSLMYANNEIGTVQEILRALGAVTSRLAGSIPYRRGAGGRLAGELRVSGLGVDALSVAGHKIGAPKGIGLAWLRGRIPVEPLMHGGGQERGRRSGTENLASAVGLAVALRLATAERAADTERMTGLRDTFVAGLAAEVPGVVFTGHPTERLPRPRVGVLPGTRRGGSAARARTSRHRVLERVGVCRGQRCAVAGAPRPR